MKNRFCGVLSPITMLPSDYGIGDIKSAIDFLDILNRYEQDYFQILPLGHTSFGDSPYQCFSAFAGNPLLISIDMLIEDNLLTYAEAYPYSSKIDYGKIISYKNNIYHLAYTNFKPDKEYFSFCNENSYWLEDYCLFVAVKNYYIDKRKNTLVPEKLLKNKKMKQNEIKDSYYGGAFVFWEDDIKNRENLTLWQDKLRESIDYNKFLQFIFFKQWKRLKDTALEKNVKIMGDIPIFVAFDSCDVWANKNLFCLNSKGFPKEVAGVPPDYFSQTGQLWGNPLYNWKEHKKDNYDWWRKRINHTLKLVDEVRVDHFRAFDTYYSIPFGEETAIEGKWKKGPGYDFFNSFDKLSIIAEDLGDLTEDVYKLRDYYNFPGMKILQFAFSDEKNNYLPHNYTNSNFVVYTGTHDNDTTVGWYRNLGEKEKDYFRRYLNVDDNAPHKSLIRLAYLSSAFIAIIPLWDILGLDEKYRINTPGVSQGNWQAFLKKEMLKEEDFEYLLYLKRLFNR